MTKQPFKPKFSDISDFNARSAKYVEYAKRLTQNRFTTGFDIVDRSIRGVGAGEVMIIAAYSGTFKSAYLQNMLMSYSLRSQLYSLFFSLEMPDEKIFEREMQIANDVTGYEVERQVNNITQTIVDMSMKAKTMGAGKVLSIERPKLTLDHIAEYVELAKVRYELGVIGIDYLGLMKGQAGRSSADLTEDMSNGAKELAKMTKLPVVLLTQINRTAAKAQSEEGAEIELHHLKYGGEAGADIVLGLYKDCQDSIILKVLKHRSGETNKRWKADITAQSLRFEGFENYIPVKKNKKNNDYDLPL